MKVKKSTVQKAATCAADMKNDNARVVKWTILKHREIATMK